MQVTQTETEGLSRTLTVVIPAGDLAKKLERRIGEIQPKVRLKGFRPGKVPPAHIRKMFGKSMMQEIVEDTVNETSQAAMSQQAIKPAAFPHIHLTADAEAVYAGQADLAYHIHVEVMPDFEPADVKGLKLERPVAEAGEAEIGKALEELASGQKTYEARRKGSKAKEEDQLLVDFVGRVDGVAFDGGSAEDAEIVIGAGRLIPGFEEQLVGAKAGETVEVKVTFPADYPRPDLAAKDAVFEVVVKDVRAPKAAEVDEDLAKAVGFETLDALKAAIKANLERQFAMQSRARLKRRLLDALDTRHAFDLPLKMVDQEFEQIWSQVQADIAKGDVAPEDKDKSEDDLKAEYRSIAERRVRLGLVLAEIGRRAGVEISEEEVARAVTAEARRYPGQERQVIEMFQKNPQARAQIRAPLYEEKVVDYIVELADVSDVKVDRDALYQDDEA